MLRARIPKVPDLVYQLPHHDASPTQTNIEAKQVVAILTNVNRQTEVRASHSLMVLSREPEIMKGPGTGPPFLYCVCVCVCVCVCRSAGVYLMSRSRIKGCLFKRAGRV